MSQPTFTPGPWRVYDNRIESMAVPADEYGTQPTVIDLHGAMGGEDTNADARLIAAAPALYAALKAVVSVADRKTDEFDAAHAALALVDEVSP